MPQDSLLKGEFVVAAVKRQVGVARGICLIVFICFPELFVVF